MSDVILHFVDPSIPGLSGRDLLRKTATGLKGLSRRVCGKSVGQCIYTRDRHLLRDIGLDRDGI